MKHMFVFSAIALALLAPSVAAHNEVVDVGGQAYIVVNDVELLVSVWQETNGLEGLQTEDELDADGNVVVPADTLVAGEYEEEHHDE